MFRLWYLQGAINGGQHGSHISVQRCQQCVGVIELFACDSLGEILDDTLRGIHANIGCQQLGFQVLRPGVIADPEIAVAEPDVVERSEAIQAPDFGAEVPIVVTENSHVRVEHHAPSVAEPVIEAHSEQEVERILDYLKKRKIISTGFGFYTRADDDTAAA